MVSSGFPDPFLFLVVSNFPKFLERYRSAKRLITDPRAPSVHSCHPVALSFGGEEPALSLSKGSMHFAGSAGARENYIDPSVREERGPQDDKRGGNSWPRCERNGAGTVICGASRDGGSSDYGNVFRFVRTSQRSDQRYWSSVTAERSADLRMTGTQPVYCFAEMRDECAQSRFPLKPKPGLNGSPGEFPVVAGTEP